MTQRKKWRRAAWFLLLFAAATFIVYGLGYRLNLTHSVPIGLWRIDGGEVHREGYAQVAANTQPWYLLGVKRKYYQSGARLLKKVVALEGDIVDYDSTEKLLTVNGKFVPLTEIVSRDSAGRNMPQMSFPVRLGAREAWLASENKRGYDSRYFGPVSLDLLRPAKLVLKM